MSWTEVKAASVRATPDRLAARMSRDELWHAVEVQSRVLGEAARRGLADDVYTALDVARAMTLAMYSTVEGA
jgi:hypothetical protein